MESTCNYCGVIDRLHTNCFFSHAVCDVCVREWYEAGRNLTAPELKALSLIALAASAPPPAETPHPEG